ncbi:MAG TPA: SMC-Scp complex subunit ScpB [Thermoanaerobaculia bacterium]|jgi:segregation and condensation protein B|nr:SMC-Scp complex subunit ScpB [Thermoanaerobaculia bacterium]
MNDETNEPAGEPEPEALEGADPTDRTDAIVAIEETEEAVEASEGEPPPVSETPARRRRERRPTERGEMEIAIEAILFVSSEPVPRGKLAELFDEEDRAEAEAAIDAVLDRFGPEVGRGFMAEEVAGGVRLATRPEVVGWLRRFFEVAAGNKLSMAALETLAIVAYRQPITAPEIQELRNVNATGTLKTLLERRLVRIAGRKEVVGKPFLYGTTREFLVHFGLNSLADLPPLEEFEETFGSDANLVDRSLETPEEGAEGATEGSAEPSAVHVADLSAGDESRERELLKQTEEIEARQEASESVEAGSTR